MKNNILVITLVVALVITGIFALNSNYQNSVLEDKILTSKHVLINDLRYDSLFYLFDQVIENPTKENEFALLSSLMNKDSQFKTYFELTLTKEQIDNKFSKEIYKYQVYDAVLLNMSNTKPDVTIFKQMKIDWEQFMYDVEPDLRGFNNPLMIADEYIELVRKMEKSFSKLK